MFIICLLFETKNGPSGSKSWCIDELTLQTQRSAAAKFSEFEMKIGQTKYMINTLSDNYHLPLPVVSFIVLALPSHPNVHTRGGIAARKKA